MYPVTKEKASKNAINYNCLNGAEKKNTLNIYVIKQTKKYPTTFYNWCQVNRLKYKTVYLSDLQHFEKLNPTF